MFKPLPREVLRWKDGMVVKLATQAVIEGHGHAVVADALEDAGCGREQENLLAYLRDARNSRSQFCPALLTVLGHKNPLDLRRAYDALGLPVPYFKISQVSLRKMKGSWPIPMVEGVTCDLVVKTLEQQGCPVWKWWTGSLDAQIRNHESSVRPEGHYLIMVKANQEADEGNANKSQIGLLAQGHQGMRLQERLLLELAYFVTTKDHLDKKKITLCPGSLVRDGGVPGVYWPPVHDRLCVHWCSPGYSLGCLCSRSAVSISVEDRVCEPQQI